MIEHVTALESQESFLDQFKEGCDGDVWMAAIWTLKEGKIFFRKTTCNFPMQEYNQSLALMKAQVDKEMGLDFSEARKTPLPRASNLTLPFVNTEKEIPPNGEVENEEIV